MSMRCRTPLLVFVLLGFLPLSIRGAEPDPVLMDELTLKSAGLPIDGEGLLDFFHQRAQGRVGRERLTALVRQLGDPLAEVRAKAATELVRIGPAAIPWLRQATTDPDDIETASQARRCLQVLDDGGSGDLPAAAARLLAVRRPIGTVVTLLAYLPFADNDQVIDEIKAALIALAYRDGKPDAALVRALADDRSIRRAFAIDVLCEGGVAEPRATLRQLLDDPRPVVRMRAALALANAKEAKAVATLVALLGELPYSHGKKVEEALIALAGEQAPKATLADDPAARDKCKTAWTAWWAASAGTGLVEEVYKRTLRDGGRVKVQALIKKLGDDSFEAREKAQRDLQGLGTAVNLALKQALKDPDAEISMRAAKVLTLIEKDRAAPLSATVVRLVAIRKPAGATEALMAFLSFADDEGIVAETQEALNALAFAAGAPDPVLVKALQDKVAVCRAAAAEALCQSGHPEQQAAVRLLLKDPEATVRMRAALALAAVQDRDAVSGVIAALGDLPSEQSSPAEEYLQLLAGDRAPTTGTGSDAVPQKRRDAWAAWWKDQGPKIELPALARGVLRQHYYGYTLFTLPQSNQVMELGTDSKVRWQLNGLSNPMDIQMLPGNRVLIAEYGANRVTERNLKNEILWEKQVNYPMGCQRLANGHTFIVSRNQLLEVDRSGKEVFNLNRNMHDIMAGHKLRDGQIILVTQQACGRLDATGKELRSFALTNGVNTNNIDFLPKGNVLIPQTWMNKVSEFDPDGKLVWEVNAQQPFSAARLPNGNTVIGTQTWPPKVIEVDKTGKTVWEYQPPTQPGRVKRR